MVTLREIAKTVGVSSGTVSRVLNYDTTLSITEAKRQAIIETAEALNYATPRNRKRMAHARSAETLTPPAPARTTTGQKVAIIHFLAHEDELQDPYYIGVRLGVENRCKEHGLILDRIFNADFPQTAKPLNDIAGVIMIGKHPMAQIEKLERYCPSIVFADFNPQLDSHDCVLSDLYRAATQVLDGLENAGYRRIAMIGGYELLDNKALMYGEGRCRAYIDWHKARDQFDPSLLALGRSNHFGQNMRLEVGYELARTLLQNEKLPDAILTANDNMAIGAYRAIQEAGLRIPEDIAVASFNDIPAAQFLPPPLSSMRIPAEAIGETAVDLLAEQFHGRSFAKHVFIPPRMCWRASCKAPTQK